MWSEKYAYEKCIEDTFLSFLGPGVASHLRIVSLSCGGSALRTKAAAQQRERPAAARPPPQ